MLFEPSGRARRIFSEADEGWCCRVTDDGTWKQEISPTFAPTQDFLAAKTIVPGCTASEMPCCSCDSKQSSVDASHATLHVCALKAYPRIPACDAVVMRQLCDDCYHERLGLDLLCFLVSSGHHWILPFHGICARTRCAVETQSTKQRATRDCLLAKRDAVSGRIYGFYPVCRRLEGEDQLRQ